MSIGGLDRASSDVAEIPQCMFELSTGLLIFAYGDSSRTRKQIEHTEELEKQLLGRISPERLVEFKVTIAFCAVYPPDEGPGSEE